MTQAKKKILIIEDSLDIREVTSHILSSHGYETMTVGEGENAIELIAKSHPDLIICDMFLEDISGLDICHKLKSNSQTASIPLILTTAHESLQNSKNGQAEKYKPDAYLYKPFEIDDLLDKISILLNTSP